MTLIDTNVILDLLHRNAKERNRARVDAARIRDIDFAVTSFVLSEVTSFIYSAREYKSLDLLLSGLGVRTLESEPLVATHDVLLWMQKYADHRPDFADAQLVLVSAAVPRCKVWTYDAEFRTVWRRPDGSAVPMAVKA